MLVHLCIVRAIFAPVAFRNASYLALENMLAHLLQKRAPAHLVPMTVTQGRVEGPASVRLSPPLLACRNLSARCLTGADSQRYSPDCGRRSQ